VNNIKTILTGLSGTKANCCVVLLLVCGLVLSVIGAVLNTTYFLLIWLTAFYFFFTIATGTLFILLIHHIIGIKWIAPLRRILENVAISTIYLALLFIPILIGNSLIYKWELSNLFFNQYLFIGVSIVCLCLLGFIALRLRRLSIAQDKGAVVDAELKRTSIVGIFVYAVCITFGAYYWIMGLDYPWFSGIFGLYHFSAAVQSAFAFIYILTLYYSMYGDLKNVVGSNQWSNLPLLILTFTLIHAYTSYSQYMLILIADLPPETTWYEIRLIDNNKVLWYLIFLLRLFIPFILLLRGKFRSNQRLMLAVSLSIVLGHFFEIYMNIAPSIILKISIFAQICAFLGVFMFFSAVMWLVIQSYMKSASLYPLQLPAQEEPIVSPISGGDIYENLRK